LDDWSNVKPLTNMSPNPIKNRPMAALATSRLAACPLPDFAFPGVPLNPR
jgi:hypothetical protein